MFLTQKTKAKNLNLRDSLNSMGDTLIIKGDLINEGEYVPSGGVLEFNGSTTDIRRVLAKKPLQVSKMRVDVPSKVSLDSGILQLKKELEVVSGTLDVDDKRITLLSDPSGSARIAELPSNALIQGQVAVQRWIPAGNAGWIDMAAPNRNGVTLEEWDDDIYLSGKSSGGFDDGCSWSSGCFWSVKRSDSTGALVDVTSTSTPLENGRGYELFIGDDGGVNTMNSDTTVTVKGRIKEPGTFNIDVNDGQWSLVANPFASPIDFDQIGLNKVDPYYYVAAATGSYEWYNRSNGNSSHPDVGPVISSSQGFWVKGNGSNASISLQQSHKSAANASFAKNDDSESLSLQLTDLSNGLSSKILLVGSNGNDSAVEVTHKPTPVLGAPDLYTHDRDSGKIRSKLLDERSTEHSIPLKVTPASQGNFRFSAQGLDALPYRHAFIEDRAMGERYPLEEKGGVQVRISASDSGKSRFFLHLSDEATALEESNESSPIEVRGKGKDLLLHFKGKKGSFRMSIYDASGRKVRKSQALRSDGSRERIRTDLADGIYIVRLQSPRRSLTRKVFLGDAR
jgi:hypothetical protein